MAITKLSVAVVDDFADGCEFGAAGPYVRIHGIAEGRADAQTGADALALPVRNGPPSGPAQQT